MLGFLRGLDTSIAREGEAQRQHQGRLLTSKENHLDRLLNQIKYNREMKFRSERADTADRQWQAGHDLRVAADERAGEVHEINMDEWERNAPVRKLTREFNIKDLTYKTGDGWDRFVKKDDLGVQQAEATLGLTKARAYALRNPQARSTGSNLKLPTFSDFEKMGAASVFPQAFTDQGKAYWLFGNKRLPYDAPTGEQSQKTYLRQGGIDLGRHLRNVLPVGQMTDDQLRTYINPYWRGMLQNEDYGPAFQEDLMHGVDPTRRTTRMTDAYRQFSDSVISGFRNPPAPKTIDSPGMGGDIEIDPGMLKSPERPDLTQPDPKMLEYMKNTYGVEGNLTPTPATGKGLDEILKDVGKAWTSGPGRRGDAYQQYFGGEPTPTPTIKPTRPSAKVLPSAQYDEAIEHWQMTGEMDWFWFDALPQDVQIRMYSSLPDYQREKFIRDHDASIMALPR